jgi:hypothetical protein
MQKMSSVRDRERSYDQTASAFSTLATSMASMIDDFVQEVTPTQLRRFDRRPMRRGRDRSCECGRCECPSCGSQPCSCGKPSECRCGNQESRCECSPREPSCECICCVGDVDLVVYTRVGETRVVPIEIHNLRRRERELEIELTAFTTNSGKPTGIEGVLTGGGKVKLGPCETINVAIVTRIMPTGDGNNNDDNNNNNNRVPDVDGCVVAYADLRILGCDMRSQRIAVAVLPRSCGGHEIECQPGCC